MIVKALDMSETKASSSRSWLKVSPEADGEGMREMGGIGGGNKHEPQSKQPNTKRKKR